MSTVPNRRDQLRERHRGAILRAAHELLEESGSPQFSADALAQRADISRRTVFNHFASIDEVVTQVCADVFTDAIDAIAAAARDVGVTAARDVDAATGDALTGDAATGGTMFDRIAPVFRSVDLTPQIAYLSRILCSDRASGRTENLLPAVFTRVTVILTDAATGGADSPGDDGLGADGLDANGLNADDLDAEILVHALMSGIAVNASRWVERFGGTLDADSRAAWFDLVDHLLDRLGRGFAAPGRP